MIVLVNQKIADFNAFKKVFVADEGERRAAGISGHRVFAVLGRPASIVITFEVSDANKASRYFASGAFQAAMRRAGGLGEPEIVWGTEVDPAELQQAACACSGSRTTELLHEPGHRGARAAVADQAAVGRQAPRLAVDPAPDRDALDVAGVAEQREVLLVPLQLLVVVGGAEVHLRDVDGQLAVVVQLGQAGLDGGRRRHRRRGRGPARRWRRWARPRP